jgi:hypothetical protein
MSLADRRLLTDYLRLDANRVTMRDRGHIMPVVTSIAVGANSGGRHEMLDLAVGANEEETFRIAFLRSFARRGLRGVEIVILDAQEEAESRACPCTARFLAAVLRAFRCNALAHQLGSRVSGLAKPMDRPEVDVVAFATSPRSTAPRSTA